MRQQGAEKASFDTIVASGWRRGAAARQSQRQDCCSGRVCSLSISVRCMGYCSDDAHLAGEWRRGERRIFTRCLTSIKLSCRHSSAAISAIRPGVRCQQVDDAARRVITEAGYGDYFGHDAGHAIGIEVREDPRFSPRAPTTLQPGMLLTVEPGIYLPGRGSCASKMLCWLPRKAQKCSTPCQSSVAHGRGIMDLSLLKALSEADAIASWNRKCGRSCWKKRIACKEEVRFDGLGSVLIRLNESTGPRR
ncbi:M24 family metallopeptidase [Escherichia coli]